MKTNQLKTAAYVIFFLFIARMAAAQVVTPAEFDKQIKQKDIQLLDVRTAEEFRAGHLEGAMQANVKNQDEFNARVKALDKSKPVYVYCASGIRSRTAAEWMKNNGFEKVVELEGGITAWKRSDFKVAGTENVPEVTTEDYVKQISSGKVVLVNFGASWCPPCVKMKPVLNELSKTYSSKLKVVNIDAGSQPSLMNAQEVQSIPTYILYQNGKEVWRKEGLTEKAELEAEIRKL